MFEHCLIVVEHVADAGVLRERLGALAIARGNCVYRTPAARRRTDAINARGVIAAAPRVPNRIIIGSVTIACGSVSGRSAKDKRVRGSVPHAALARTFLLASREGLLASYGHLQARTRSSHMPHRCASASHTTFATRPIRASTIHRCTRRSSTRSRGSTALGLDLAWFTEHHFVDDGYLPSWVPIAGAMAARTKRIRFNTDICLLPFNHPIRLAEDLAVLDNLSNGRVEIGCGMGYAPHEFRGFGMPVSRRVSMTDEGVEVLKRCFTGETLQLSRQALSLRRRAHHARVRAAGRTAAVARRDVARRRAFAPRSTARTSCRRARAIRCSIRGARRCARRTTISSHYRVGIIRGCLVTDDKERDWPIVREAERYRMRLYSRFFAGVEADGLGGGRAQIPQSWIVGDVNHCVAELVRFHQDVRHHRHRDVGRAAGRAAAGHDRESRGVCDAGGAAGESRDGGIADVIRSATHEDAAAIAGIYNHYILNSVITFEEEAVSPTEMAGRIGKVRAASLPYLVGRAR